MHNQKWTTFRRSIALAIVSRFYWATLSLSLSLSLSNCWNNKCSSNKGHLVDRKLNKRWRWNNSGSCLCRRRKRTKMGRQGGRGKNYYWRILLIAGLGAESFKWERSCNQCSASSSAVVVAVVAIYQRYRNLLFVPLTFYLFICIFFVFFLSSLLDDRYATP